MRGIRQLGLAQLVFPSASHSRLEHIIGVIGAVEEITRALGRQIERWNRDNKDSMIAPIVNAERYALRLAALFHDVGHGPFSHALEPVLEVKSPLRETFEPSGWRADLKEAQSLLKASYTLNKEPAPSEVMSVMLIASDAFTEIARSDGLFPERKGSGRHLQESMIAAVIGAVEGPGATYLSAVISSQLDADRMDFLARDSYHAGLEIGFDTSRLLSRLEVLRVTADKAEEAAIRERVARQESGVFYQIGIAASGFGSFEQMLIGRTFLYDRIYHHHKVRAAEAMAQRLMLIAERDREDRFSLDELFLAVSDDTMLQIFAGNVTHSKLQTPCNSARALAQGILDRELFHRAFAFRGRFIASPPALGAEKAKQNQKRLWGRLVKSLDNLYQRYQLGDEIHKLAVDCSAHLANIPEYEEACSEIANVSADQIIVDLPDLKAEGIRVLARYPNGAIRVPEFSFNPAKWADAYELQKRTSFVFCPKTVVPLVSLAARLVFLKRFGVAMAKDADGFIKAGLQVKEEVWSILLSNGITDAEAIELLSSRRYSLIAVRADELGVPSKWLLEDPDLDSKLAVSLNKALVSGLTHEHLSTLTKTLSAMFSIVDVWFDSHRVTGPLAAEDELQNFLRDQLRASGDLEVTEGTRVSGGNLDLLVDGAVVIENKFHGEARDPSSISKSAGMQGRRYAISLGSQVVIVATGYQPKPGSFPNKPSIVEVRPVTGSSENRVEVRFSFPYNAVTPSREKAAPKD